MNIGRLMTAVFMFGLSLAGWPGQTTAQQMEFFRIGTGGAGGTYYPIGGVIAQAISNPPGSRPCGQGGSCGVEGLIAVAQSSNGSISNIKAIDSGGLESGFAQSDVVYWAFTGTGVFRGSPPLTGLRAITSLYQESFHLVARPGLGIKSVRDLKGKRVSLDEPGSGTLVDARIILKAFGLSENDLMTEYIKPEIAADRMARGQLDAFFIVAGYPTPAVHDLAAGSGAELVAIDGPEAAKIIRENEFLIAGEIPAGAYGNNPPVRTVNVGSQWIVSDRISERLVYQITRALWNESSRRLLDNGHPKGDSIVLDKALDGIGIPLHPGARRYYREIGMVP